VDEMVEVELGKEYVTFKLEGAQKFLALKNLVRIPFRNIDIVSTETVKPLWLYYVRDRSKCITLKLRDHEYSKVVMEVDDKENVANNLRKLKKK